MLSPSVAVYIQGTVGLFLDNRNPIPHMVKMRDSNIRGEQTSAGKYNLTCSYWLFVIFGSGPKVWTGRDSLDCSVRWDKSFSLQNEQCA